LASGLAAAQSFQSPEAARAAAQWMATLESNWESAKPDFTRLPANMKSVIAWIRIQTNTPTLDEIKKKAAA
jgi:hypothetical protein